MNTITIPKTEYRKLVQTQKELMSQFEKLEKIIKESEPEIRPSVLRRWERISKEMDKSRSIRFKSVKEVKDFFRNL